MGSWCVEDYVGFSLGRFHMGGGDLSPHIGGQVPGDKTLMGGTHEGGHRPYGGPNFDTLYHKQKVLLINVKLQCNLPQATILLKLVDSYLIAFKFANNAASIQKNSGDKSHHVIVALLILL